MNETFLIDTHSHINMIEDLSIDEVLENASVNHVKKIIVPAASTADIDGLDYYWDKSYIDVQKEVFIKQIELANELGLPINVHDREAHKDTFDIIKAHNKGSKVIMHCFSGSPEFAKECVREGWYIALGGVVTFKNAKKMKEVAIEVPLEKLLLETDAPYLTPVPYRGKENQPAYVKFVAEEIAKLRGISFDEVAKATTKNAKNIFFI